MTKSTELDPKEYLGTLELLKKIDFLHGVPDENLKSVLFSLQKESFAKERKILFQGEIANRLFIIRQGSVKISTKSKGSRLELAELKSPMYFGEISLLRPTSATATATSGEEGAELLILTSESMTDLSTKVPDITQRIQKVIDDRIASKKKAKDADEKESE